MGVLLEIVMLDLPHVVDPEPIGDLDLVQGIAKKLALAPLRPGPRHLVFVEETESHGSLSTTEQDKRSVAPK